MLKSKKIGELRQEDHEIWENQYVHRDSGSEIQKFLIQRIKFEYLNIYKWSLYP